jgi:hypothetical protein
MLAQLATRCCVLIGAFLFFALTLTDCLCSWRRVGNAHDAPKGRSRFGEARFAARATRAGSSLAGGRRCPLQALVARFFLSFSSSFSPTNSCEMPKGPPVGARAALRFPQVPNEAQRSTATGKTRLGEEAEDSCAAGAAARAQPSTAITKNAQNAQGNFSK